MEREARPGRAHVPAGPPCTGVQAVHCTGRLAGAAANRASCSAKPWPLALAAAAQRDHLFLIQIKMPFQASGGAISRLPPNKAAPQAPPRAGAGRAALAGTQHGLEAAHTNSRSPRPLATSQASAPKPKPVDTIGHHSPQARVTWQGRHVGWRPSCLPGGSTTPSLCLPTPLLYPGKTKQVSAQGNPVRVRAG